MRKVRRLLKENWIPIVVGILLTKWAVDYAYRVRGYDAIGSEWLHSVLTNTPGVDDFEELLMNGGISNIKIKLDQYPSTKSVMVKEGS